MLWEVYVRHPETRTWHRAHRSGLETASVNFYASMEGRGYEMRRDRDGVEVQTTGPRPKLVFKTVLLLTGRFLAYLEGWESGASCFSHRDELLVVYFDAEGKRRRTLCQDSLASVGWWVTRDDRSKTGSLSELSLDEYCEERSWRTVRLSGMKQQA